MEEAWTFPERILYSHALMNRLEAFSGAILDSGRDGVQVHASHFSRPPSLTVAEGGLYSRLLLEDGQDVFSCACLRSSLARGTRLGRCLMTRRNFPDVWYKSKKEFAHLSSFMSVFASLVLFTFDVCLSNRCTRTWWVGGIECAR